MAKSKYGEIKRHFTAEQRKEMNVTEADEIVFIANTDEEISRARTEFSSMLRRKKCSAPEIKYNLECFDTYAKSGYWNTSGKGVDFYLKGWKSKITVHKGIHVIVNCDGVPAGVKRCFGIDDEQTGLVCGTNWSIKYEKVA